MSQAAHSVAPNGANSPLAHVLQVEPAGMLPGSHDTQLAKSGAEILPASQREHWGTERGGESMQTKSAHRL
jgi:hypothetical protein